MFDTIRPAVEAQQSYFAGCLPDFAIRRRQAVNTKAFRFSCNWYYH